jgi:hypothetical protein
VLGQTVADMLLTGFKVTELALNDMIVFFLPLQIQQQSVLAAGKGDSWNYPKRGSFLGLKGLSSEN